MSDEPPPLSETQSAAIWVRRRAASWTQSPDNDELNEVLRRMARWRSRLLANTFIQHHGAKVRGGIFAGMEYVSAAAEGALVPRLFGTYEDELHPHILSIVAGGLDCVIDVGCAEGYYAVGLARLAPQVTVHAYDIDETARQACAELAEINGVADRVRIAGEFRPGDFQAFAGRRSLVVVDAEGAEVDILLPDEAPALAGMSLIVETHDVYRKGAMREIVRRFEATHDIVRVDQKPKVFDPPRWLLELPHLDQLLAVWEWRLKPTPWLVMRPKTETPGG